MQCKSCGAEWKTNARTAVIVRCPFCGAELEQEKENKVVFQSAKEALRYIIKNYGVDVLLDGLQLKTVLSELIPDMKQERKVFMDAYEVGVCNALYLAHDQPEIDKCIAILQSIKVLTQDAMLAEKWACYVVETYVYALNWNVPMFGITPNIHMYQIPENINESGENGRGMPLLTQSTQVWEDQENSGDDMWNKSSDDKDEFVLPSQLPEQTAAQIPVEETKPQESEFKPESPVFDFTDETETAEPERKLESPVFDFTDEAEETKEEPKEEPKSEKEEPKPAQEEAKPEEKPESKDAAQA